MRSSFTFTVLLCSSMMNQLFSQNAPLWNGLSPGPYKVGFKAEWKIDYTRTWGQSELVEEVYAKRPFGRPVRLTIWYPAQVENSENENRFRDYVFIDAADATSVLAQSIVLRNDIGSENKSLHGLFSGNEKAYEQLLVSNVPSYKDAQALEGKRFPLIIYSLGQNDYTLENTILFEYLASRGFIVVTVPHLGMNPRKDYLLIDDALSFDTQVQDLAFALSEMLKFPNVDATKVGGLGMSMGSVYTLLLAGRNGNIKALVGLDGSVMGGLEPFAYKYQNLPYYDSSNVKVPVLEIFRGGHHNLSVMSSLIYCDRYLFEIEKLIHADFTSSPLYTLATAKTLPDTSALAQRSAEYAADQYKKICEYTRLFFSATLNEDKVDTKRLTTWRTSGNLNGLTSTFMAGLPSPNEEEFAKIVSEHGSNAAIEKLMELQQKKPGIVWLRQNKLNRMAYEYVYKNDLNRAIELFKFNVAAFPNEFGVFGSLADGYEMLGNNDLALKNYERALELNPGNQDIKKSVERLKLKE